MCMHAYVESLKKKKPKRNEGCEKIQKGRKYDSAEMIKMLKKFYGASSGRGTHIYKHTFIHYTCIRVYDCTRLYVYTNTVSTHYIFLNISEKRATLLFELKVQQCKVLAIHTRSKNVI